MEGRNRTVATVVVLLALGGLAAWVLWPRPASEVTLYCSVDQDHSLSIAERYEKETGVDLRYQGDVEASRSVGIAQRLFQERGNPVADVLWGNEAMQTAALGLAGVLAPLPAGIADDFPTSARDPDGRWIAFAQRARVILVNRELLPDETQWPRSVSELVDPKWGGAGRGVVIAKPLSGTTMAHAVALLVRDGEKAKDFWSRVAERSAKGEGVKLVTSNGTVMNQVSDAKNGIAWGVTDTDDARIAIGRGDPVSVVYPDQGEGQPGTLVIPNTVALVKGAPHPKEAERLMRYLLSRENEQRLAEGPSAQIPIRDSVPAPAHVKRPGKDFRAMDVDWKRIGAERDSWLTSFLQPTFMK